MPYEYGDEKDEDGEWPHDDLPAAFDVDEEFKEVEDYVDEYEYGF